MIRVFLSFLCVKLAQTSKNICHEIYCKTKDFAENLLRNVTISVRDFVPKIQQWLQIKKYVQER